MHVLSVCRAALLDCSAPAKDIMGYHGPHAHVDPEDDKQSKEAECESDPRQGAESGKKHSPGE